MLRMKERLDKLERALVPAKGPRQRLRVVVSAIYAAPDLVNSTCTRTLAKGVPTEVVHLDGDGNELSDEQLERFIESFPIQEEVAAW
jgi:hypothetical protein